MIRIIQPTKQRIQGIQEETGRYYWSVCAANFLRQHGLITVSEDSGVRDKATLPIHLSNAEPDGSSRGLFDGPVSLQVLSHFGLKAKTHRRKSLLLIDPDIETQFRAEYPLHGVHEALPHELGFTDPWQEVSKDPLLNATDISFQEIAPAGDFRPCLLALDPDTNATMVVGVANEQCRIFGVPLFDILNVLMAVPPLSTRFWGLLNEYDTGGLVSFTLRQIATLSCQLSIPLVKVTNWPPPYTSAFTVRHDYDRLISNRELQSILNDYNAKGIKCTWYTLVRRAPEDQLQCVANQGHEIALHTEAKSYADFLSELNKLQNTSDNDLVGVTAHGGIDALGYVGDVQLQWGESANLLYGETYSRKPALPHRVNHARSSIPATSDYLVSGCRRAFEISMTKQAMTTDEFCKESHKALCAGEHLNVLHHPDILQQEWREYIERVDLSSSWCATHRQVVDWVDAAKYASRLRRKRLRTRLMFPYPLPEPALILVGQPPNERQVVCEKGTTEVVVPFP